MSSDTAEGSADRNDSLKASEIGTSADSGPRTQNEITEQMDPGDICYCGPCQRFWSKVLKNSYLAQAKEEGSLAVKNLGKVQRHQIMLSVGDRVTVQGKTGSVKYVDFVDDTVMAPVLRVGIRLDESVPEGHDGVYQGKRYFHCTDGHGIFARVTEVAPLPVAKRRPMVRGNTMFPSWSSVCQKRREHEALVGERLEKQQRAAERRRFMLMRKMPPPPSISPRGNRAHQLRKEMICLEKMPDTYLTFREDPSDMAVKDDYKRGKKKGLLVASLSSSPDTARPTKSRSLQKQWREKYQDPDKASRMEETLLKLCSAYQEGAKFKHLYAD